MRILVTGGARRIGAHIAASLAGAGNDVVIHHHDSADEAEALAASVRALPGLMGSVGIVSGDLAVPGAARAVLRSARDVAGGCIDGLVNNASIFLFDRPGADDFALLDAHMHVNLAAPVALASALAEQPDLVSGAVVNLLDQKLANLNPDFFSYTCSKAALEAATVMLAQALAPRVRVNAVSPGITLPSLDQTEAEFEAVARDNLLREAVDLDDIVDTVAHLLTCRSVTGQNVFVDCGQRFVKRDGDVMFAMRERPHG